MKTIQSYLSNDLYYFCIQEKYQLFLDMKISKKNFKINQIRKLIYSCNLQERFPFKLDLNKEFEYTQLGILVLSNDNIFHLINLKLFYARYFYNRIRFAHEFPENT